MKELNIEKIYFVPGNIVTLKHDWDNKPLMLVTEVVNNKIIDNYINYLHVENPHSLNEYSSDTINTAISTVDVKPKKVFVGIRCGWFTKNQEWEEQIFSTKDLIKIEKEK